jgi:exopolysaccharide production protein ExoY
MLDAQGIEAEKPWSSIEIKSESSGFEGRRQQIIGRASKRMMDVVLSLLTVLILSPILLIVAIIIKASDGGPIIYSHQRIGRRGASFGCLKFRSMRPDAAAQLAYLLDNDPAARQEWDATRKLKNDPRVTVVGDILRKSSLDELPQLINVLRGDMSLVGPRPITSEEQSHYGEHITAYFAVRPGLTGRWQVSGRNDVSYQHRVLLDAHYVRNWSFLADLVIMAKTVPALFTQRGSY